jgi:hypothetical protein
MIMEDGIPPCEAGLALADGMLGVCVGEGAEGGSGWPSASRIAAISCC